MPSAYRLDTDAARIAQWTGADAGEDPWAGGIVRPGDFAPVVLRSGARRMLVPRQWGVPPPPRSGHPVTHLRNPESPFWIGVLRHTEFRCLVPATVRGSGLVAWAGVWRDSEVPSFAIVTVAGAAGRSVPLALPPALWRIWLSAEWKQAQNLL